MQPNLSYIKGWSNYQSQLHSPQRFHVGVDLEDTNIKMGMSYQVGTM